MSTKINMSLRTLAIFALVASASASFTWDSCGTKLDRLKTSNVKGEGSFTAGSKVTITASGDTYLHAPLESGAWQVRIYELGMSKETSTSVGDLMSALKFLDAKNTTFEVTVSFTLPAKQASGDFNANLVAVDQAKADYMCLDIKYNYTSTDTLALGNISATGCKSDTDCHAGGDMSGYCKANGDCHCSEPFFSTTGSTCKLSCCPKPDGKTCTVACCRDDADCQVSGDKGAYCKSPKSTLHTTPGNGQCRCSAGFAGTTSCEKAELPASLLAVASRSSTVGGVAHCTKDSDCPSSYCQNGVCHACGDECCTKDSDCPGSYCANDPTKMPPYTCHGSTKNAFAVAMNAPAGEITMFADKCSPIGTQCTGTKADPTGSCCKGNFCKYYQPAPGNLCQGCFNCKCPDGSGPGAVDDPNKCIDSQGDRCDYQSEC